MKSTSGAKAAASAPDRTAGTFAHCVKIEEANTFDPAYVASSGGMAPSHRTRWLAPGVGPVRYETVYVNAIISVVATNTGQLTSRTLVYTAPNNLWPLAVGNTWVIKESDQASTCAWSISAVQY